VSAVREGPVSGGLNERLVRGHWLDRAFARYSRGDGLFGDGWGDWQEQRRIGRAASDVAVVDRLNVHLNAPQTVRSGYRLVVGQFKSPLADDLPGRVRDGRFWWLRPAKSENEPVWVHMAGTGESGARRRLFIARPLAKRGISSLILENPFYGTRAPVGQSGNDLRTVAELLHMGRAAVREARALVGWLGEQGHNRRGVSGYSMGGHIAALAAATFPEPIACAAMATGLSAVPIFTEDELSKAIRWDVLGNEVDDPRALMGELIALSDVSRFSPPPIAKACVLLGARNDAYVRTNQIRALHDHWPGSDLRWFGGGHVAAYVRRKSLVDALLSAIGHL
jgi:hypothetical protein